VGLGSCKGQLPLLLLVRPLLRLPPVRLAMEEFVYWNRGCQVEQASCLSCTATQRWASLPRSLDYVGGREGGCVFRWYSVSETY
jgi:hypothetical protein